MPRPTPGAPLRIARIGRFEFDAEAFDRTAIAILEAERHFWRDRSQSPFLTTSIPLTPAPNRMSYSGTGRSDAFATWIDSRADIEGLSWLIAHEYMHTWVPRQLGELPPRDEEQAYWFSEGFTDYLTRRVMLEAGLWTPDRFARDWNEVLRAYATSTFRLTPNAEAARVQWTGGIDAEKLPYQRGAMLAAIWHHQLAQRGSSLDQMLRSMRDDIARSARRPPDAASGFQMAARRAGFDVRAADGATRRITYRPASSERFELQRVEVTPQAAGIGAPRCFASGPSAARALVQGNPTTNRSGPSK